MMFSWSYCLPWWQWLVRPWPWSVDRGQCSPSRVTPLSSREYAVVSLWCLHEWWIIFDIYACVSVCVCASLTLDQCTRSLTCQELTRGYVYFTVKTLKQTLNVAQAPQAGWLVTKGRLTLIGFDSRGGGNSATAGVTWRLSTEYVLKYTAYIQTCACVGESLCLLAASQPWLV